MPKERLEVKSIITQAARNAVMEEAGNLVSSMTSLDRLGPTLLLDAVEPDEVRFVKRYCEWLGRGLVSDAYIAARFERSYLRLKRLGKRGEFVVGSKDMPGFWEGAGPGLAVISRVLKHWAQREALNPEEQRIISICLNECTAKG